MLFPLTYIHVHYWEPARLLYIMLEFFRAFRWGKSIEHYSSILVAFSRKIIFFSQNIVREIIILREFNLFT